MTRRCGECGAVMGYKHSKCSGVIRQAGPGTGLCEHCGETVPLDEGRETTGLCDACLPEAIRRAAVAMNGE